ncbi:MAG: GH25 family lysozyme [Bacteroidales bacterium]|nr:GH25 family lysozyme [Bacteroidales bacterium]
MKKKNKKRLIKWTIVISIIFVLFSFANFFYNYFVDYYRNYYACEGVVIDNKKYPVYGIDVSSHQDEIEWERVSNDNIKFCFIKATEGKDFVDKRYKENYIGARENNILIGAYHFFRFGSSGKEQAQNFIKNVAIEHLDFPPVLDVERHGNYFSFYKTNQIRVEIKNYLQEIERLYSIKPIIYTNLDGYQKYIEGYFPQYEIWICKICSEPQNHHWSFWQYSHKGEVSGISTKVDLNTFNGSEEDFIDYLNNYKQKLI